jgi:VWFA-related protein
MEDLLVLEDGVPQQIRSIRKIPANILLLLDTGNEITLAKSVNVTRGVAMRLLANLHGEQRVAVMQFNERVQLLQDWTTDMQQVTTVLKKKLFSGKRSRLSEGVQMAAEKLMTDTPAGSRHVVIITDGVEQPGGRISYADAVKRLVAAQATVHIISYTTLVRLAIDDRGKRGIVRKGDGVQRDGTPGGQDPTLPPGMTRSPSVTFMTIDLDREMRRWYKKYSDSTKESEARLVTLASETGGQILLPTTTEAMLAHGEEVARDIGAQYVVTYRPKRPLSEARAGEYRRIEVAARRTGVTLRARRGYVVTQTQ